MAGRAVHGPPYWRGLFAGITEEGLWRRFDGWCAARGIDLLASGQAGGNDLSWSAGRASNLIEYWLEEESATDGDTKKAKDEFRKALIKQARLVEDLRDPDKAVEIANIAPHLIGRR